MCKGNTNNSDSQEKVSISFPHAIPGKDMRVDFNAPDISSNGELIIAGSLLDTIAGRVGRLIPDFRNKDLIQHTYAEMVCQRVGQILCGIHHRLQHEAHTIRGHGSGGLHDGQPDQAGHAERRLHQGEKNIRADKLLATPPAQGSPADSLAEMAVCIT